jgi:hypothetical protein
VPDLPAPTAAIAAELAGFTVAELAAAIAAELAAAELPADIAEWVREMTAGAGGQWRQWQQIGSGYKTCLLESVLNPDGTIRLELRRWDGARCWSHIIRPAYIPAPVAAAEPGAARREAARRHLGRSH